MAEYKEAQRFLYLKTPLGPDDLLLAGFSGHEAISQLFEFQLDLLAENATQVPFDKLLGQRVSFGVAGVETSQQKRHLNGIVSRMTQLSRDRTFTQYRMVIVPQVWTLTQKFQSRIFQHINVPDILKKVLDGLDVDYEIQGTFEQREFCVQYQESDFAFAQRLMEEEGIYFFFKFTEGNHKLVLANSRQSHPDVPDDATLIYEEIEGGLRDEERISVWEKAQDLRSGKYTLWDHHFQLPHKHLEADQTVLDSVTVGTVNHKLKVAGNDSLEIYEHPGRYAQRFDGIDKGGGEKPADLQKITVDNKRTVAIRMQQTEMPMILIWGQSNYRQMVPGHKFTLERHFNANGEYVIVSVDHEAAEGAFRTGSDEENHYSNTFTAIPFELPFRPPRVTPRPLIQGCQTAVVVGPSGEEIFTDKYGRIKVQFHWDRENQYDANSSCWVRVATTWAGNQWGAISIPRIGMEVIVDFIEGDPDRPIVTGVVYNAQMMPSYTLPANKTRSGVKTRSSLGGGGFNEIRFEDKKGSEQVFIHAEKDMDVRVKEIRREWIGTDRHLVVAKDKYEEVDGDSHIQVKGNRMEQVTDENLKATGKVAIDVGQSYSCSVGTNLAVHAGANAAMDAAACFYIKGMNVVVEGGTGVTLTAGGSFVTVNAAGVQIQGPIVLINSGGVAIPGVPGVLVPPAPVKNPLVADDAVPGGPAPTYQNQIASMSPSQAAAAAAPNHDPNSEENKKKPDWIELELIDENGKPAVGVAYRVTLPDGSVSEGTLDEKGAARVENIDPGQCKITFPDFHKEAWEPQ